MSAKSILQRFEAGGRSIELDPHQEAPRLTIVELRGIDDVSALTRQKTGNICNKAGAIIALKCKSVGFGHDMGFRFFV